MSNLPDNIRAMYTDAYKLHETLAGMGNTEEDWSKAVALGLQVCVHHGEHPLMIDLMNAVIDQLNRERNPKDGA